jgi:hypothetical protein
MDSGVDEEGTIRVNGRQGTVQRRQVGFEPRLTHGNALNPHEGRQGLGGVSNARKRQNPSDEALGTTRR